MKRNGAQYLMPLSLLLFLFIVHLVDAIDAGANGETISASKNVAGADLSGAKLAPPDSEKVAEEKKAKEETKGEIEKKESKETVIKEKGKSLEEPESQERNQKGGSNGDSDVEVCDPSNRCVDEKSKFVACLRVPGKDSLDLSLMIQNKGKESLDIIIVAPDFVNLEQSTVQLKAKEDKEVKVSVKDGGNDTTILLKAGEGSCSLNFQNPISDPIKNTETSSLPGFFSHLSIRSSFILISLGASLVIVLSWCFIKFRRMKSQESSQKYQQIDAGLPISTGGKKDISEGDGWDNSWGDDWDDEEAPMTPSKPVLTPSSKGLASRKFNKDSWKD
ncbi:uncharacterized protein A4U43_C01F3370 [Asparagus officinalis]|uniref:DUF7356 domain-containing protein n=1 Tax=Asparagus officinalis TaxID=4686 RepID=A0A5P1FN32_ASPOF|nr:uncharacterized protein LOC109847443 [Asparagus officinalis]ONK79143.1 uncharacterized protein A4U43_C01F3370 [Asparagus officinalis]